MVKFRICHMGSGAASDSKGPLEVVIFNRTIGVQQISSDDAHRFPTTAFCFFLKIHSSAILSYKLDFKWILSALRMSLMV